MENCRILPQSKEFENIDNETTTVVDAPTIVGAIVGAIDGATTRVREKRN